jgi:hypothetical protein
MPTVVRSTHADRPAGSQAFINESTLSGSGARQREVAPPTHAGVVLYETVHAAPERFGNCIIGNLDAELRRARIPSVGVAAEEEGRTVPRRSSRPHAQAGSVHLVHDAEAVGDWPRIQDLDVAPLGRPTTA